MGKSEVYLFKSERKNKMRGKKAKRLRKKVYGDMSIRDTKYFRNNKTGQITADSMRTAYQHSKKGK